MPRNQYQFVQQYDDVTQIFFHLHLFFFETFLGSTKFGMRFEAIGATSPLSNVQFHIYR